MFIVLHAFYDLSMNDSQKESRNLMNPFPDRMPSFCGRIAYGSFYPGVSELLSISRCVRNFQEKFAEAAA